MTACCLSTYLLRWFELQQRLRYKSQLPPAVAAMQGHLYGLPPGLMVAQVGGGDLGQHAEVAKSVVAVFSWFELCWEGCGSEQSMRQKRSTGARGVGGGGWYKQGKCACGWMGWGKLGRSFEQD